jgi:hypothetical protein
VSELRSDGQGGALSHLRFQRAQRVADDDALPTQVDQGKVVGLSQVCDPDRKRGGGRRVESGIVMEPSTEVLPSCNPIEGVGC